MLMVSDRTKKIIFSLAYIAVLLLAASAGFASEGGEGAHHVDKGAQLKDLGWRVLNFVVLLGILGYALKKADVKGSLAALRPRSKRISRMPRKAGLQLKPSWQNIPASLIRPRKRSTSFRLPSSARVNRKKSVSSPKPEPQPRRSPPRLPSLPSRKRSRPVPSCVPRLPAWLSRLPPAS